MKVKTYPDEIIDPIKFVKEYLLNDKGQLKAPALSALPDKLKTEILSIGSSKGLKSDNISENVFWISNELNDYPKKCKSCGGPITKFHSFSRGYPHVFCSSKCSNSSKEVKAKKIIASKEKYGTEFPWQNKEVKAQARESYVLNWFEKRFTAFAPEYIPVTTKEEYKSVRTKFRWRHECGHEFEQDASNGIIKPNCPACRTAYGGSRPQRDIYDYIKSICVDQIIIQNDRSTIFPLELDIYIPDKKLAIEFHGLYWHSYDRKETKREIFAHREKQKLCAEAGIKLIQIYEYEWAESRDIVKARIKSALGADNRIFARKCDIVKLENSECREFLEAHHIQGHSQASIKVGLKYNGQLVAVMTFCRPRFSKKYEWEIARYCSIGTVVGGASKLLAHFKKTHEPKSIVSYADLRWGNGNLYQELGFSLFRISDPNYFYFRGRNRYSRYAFQKSNLKNVLETFDETKSEHDNAFMNGYRRCWDAGNLVFGWTNE